MVASGVAVSKGRGFMAITIHRNDDALVPLTLREAGVPLNVSTSQVFAEIQDRNGCVIISALAQSAATAGASWSTGVVVVSIPRTYTALLTPGNDYVLIVRETTAAALRRVRGTIAIDCAEGLRT